MSTQTVEIVGQGWQLVYDAATQGPFNGRVIVATSDSVEFRTDTVTPAAAALGWPASVMPLSLSQFAGDKLYARSMDGQALLVLDDLTVPGAWPRGVFTSSPDAEGFGRLRVDVGETGLFEAREFRVVRKLVLTGTALVWRFTSAVDFILHEQTFGASEGDLEFHAWRAADVTPSGTFATPVRIIGKNGSSEYREFNGARYVSQVSIMSGGSITPIDAEEYVDYDRAKTASSTAQRSSVGGTPNSVRYLPAGTYYLQITGTGEGRLALAWEERP